MLVSPNPIGVVNVSASVDAGVLEDARFYLQRPNYGSKPNCNGRFLQFATQVNISFANTIGAFSCVLFMK